MPYGLLRVIICRRDALMPKKSKKELLFRPGKNDLKVSADLKGAVFCRCWKVGLTKRFSISGADCQGRSPDFNFFSGVAGFSAKVPT